MKQISDRIKHLETTLMKALFVICALVGAFLTNLQQAYPIECAPSDISSSVKIFDRPDYYRIKEFSCEEIIRNTEIGNKGGLYLPFTIPDAWQGFYVMDVYWLFPGVRYSDPNSVNFSQQKEHWFPGAEKFGIRYGRGSEDDFPLIDGTLDGKRNGVELNLTCAKSQMREGVIKPMGLKILWPVHAEGYKEEVKNPDDKVEYTLWKEKGTEEKIVPRFELDLPDLDPNEPWNFPPQSVSKIDDCVSYSVDSDIDWALIYPPTVVPYSFDLKGKISLRRKPRRIPLGCFGDDSRGDAATYEKAVLWIYSPGLMADCHQFAASRLRAREVSQTAREAIDLLLKVLRNSNYSMPLVLTYYFEEQEDVLNHTINFLEENKSSIGELESALLITEIKAVSIIRSSDCLAGWDMLKIRKTPQAFLNSVNKCYEKQGIALDRKELLELIVNALVSPDDRELKAIIENANKGVFEYLGNMPDIASSYTVGEEILNQRAGELLSFLKSRNQRAYRDCKRFINWM